MTSMPESQPLPDPEALREAIGSGDPMRALPSLARLREFPSTDDDALVVPLLILGSEQSAFVVRSLSCSGLGMRRNEQGWAVLTQLVSADEDANVRAEAANALASFGVERSWPLLRERFVVDDAWLVRCSILSALAEDPSIDPAWLLDLAQLAINEAMAPFEWGHGNPGRLVHDSAPQAAEARALLQELQRDGDHRVVAAALNGLQTSADGAC